MDIRIRCKALQLVDCFILPSIVYHVAGICLQDSRLSLNYHEKVSFDRAKQYCDSYNFTGLLDENCINDTKVQMELKRLLYLNGSTSLDIWIKENERCKIVKITCESTRVYGLNWSENAYAACKYRSRDAISTTRTLPCGTSSYGIPISRTTFIRTSLNRISFSQTFLNRNSKSTLTSTTLSRVNGVQSTTAVSMESGGVLTIQTIFIAISSIVLFGLIMVAIYLAGKYIQQKEKIQHDGAASNHTTYTAALYNFSLCDSEFKYDYVTVQPEENEATYRNQNANATCNRDENPFKVESHTYGNNPSSSPHFDTRKVFSERKMETHLYGNSPGISPKFCIQSAPDRRDKESSIRPNLSSTCADIHESELHHKLSLAVMENMYTNTTLK